MRPFTYEQSSAEAETSAQHFATSKYLAGGTTLIDLMKLDVERPQRIVDINAQHEGLDRIERNGDGLRLGALVRMSDAAADRVVAAQYPVIAQSLLLAASQQIRNMASLGGNVLQRTRCAYFRDVSYAQCNKRNPGSGCAARDGINRQHAVLGTTEDCISAYPGDFAQALMALDALVDTDQRTFPFAKLHKTASDPASETILQPGEMIRSFIIPPGNYKRSLYLKIRDRESYQFALTSAAVVLEGNGNAISKARIALGGVAYHPWRAREAEAELEGKTLNEESAARAAEIAFRNAQGHEYNAFKIDLGKQTLIRALMEAKDLEA